ncbi:MAG: hypothetical protein ABSG46_11130 [Candidatus Binataceae bacterium]|jgi:hypothetical protein
MMPFKKPLAFLALGSLLALPAMAQENAMPRPDQSMMAPAPMNQPIATVANGNTIIQFNSAASNPDLDQENLQAWGEFAGAHPRVANTLAYKPSLINNPQYLNKHPELAQFFAEHPSVKDAMMEDPGNFVAIPPRPGE